MKNVITGVSLILSITALIIAFQKKQSETVYVDGGKVFSEFELAKKLNKDLDLVLSSRKNILDSLYQEMKVLTMEVKAEGAKNPEKLQYLAELEEAYYIKQQQFQEDNKAATETYMAKVWNQLNQYISDYGQMHNLTYILGATGQGNIMYAEKERNITENIIQYINSRYNDKINK